VVWNKGPKNETNLNGKRPIKAVKAKSKRCMWCMFIWKKDTNRTYCDAHTSDASRNRWRGTKITFCGLFRRNGAQDIYGRSGVVRRWFGTLNRIWRSWCDTYHFNVWPVGLDRSIIDENGEIHPRSLVWLYRGVRYWVLVSLLVRMSALEVYGGRSKVVECRGRAVDIDSSSYTRIECM